jgi:hypothetical protein
LLLTAGMLLMAGLAAGMLQLITAVPAPRFVPLWVSEYRSPLVPDNMAGERDRRAIHEGQYFACQSAGAIGSLPRHRLVEELAALEKLSEDDSTLIYISAYAEGSEAGELCLLPADFVAGDAHSRLPLAEVLQHVQRSPARHKLLVLDLMWPVAEFGIGTYNNDAAALAAKEIDKLTDPNLLVLCAASAWQTSLVSPELGRSVFGHYFEQGLRGYAEGCGPDGRADGRIRVRELAEYLRQRVDRWAWDNGRQRQTPWLAGHGADFELLAMPNGRPLPPLRPIDQHSYPAWLRDAWKTRDIWRAGGALAVAPRALARLEHELLTTEEAWRFGEDASLLESELKSKLAALARSWEAAQRSVAGPPARSLAMLRWQGLKSDPAISAALDDLLSKLSAQTAGLQAAPALAVRQKLIGQFHGQVKAVPPATLALAIIDQVAAETSPQPDVVRLLDSLLAARQPQPQYVETAFVRRLAGLAEHVPQDAWPAGAVRQALQVVRQGEETASFHRGWKRAQPLVEQAAVERHTAETILLNPGYAPVEESARRLRTSASVYEQALGRLRTLDDAGSSFEEGIWQLRAIEPLVDDDESRQFAWLAASSAITELAGLLASPAAAFESIRQRTATVRQRVEDSAARLAPSNIARLVEQLHSTDAGPAAIAQASLLLKTPCLAAGDRATLWQARQAAALRLAWRTYNRDLLTGASRQSSADLEAYASYLQQSREEARAAARAGRSLAMREMAGATNAPLEEQLAKATDLFARDRLSRIYPPQSPCLLLDEVDTNPTLALRRREALESWQWLAGWYRYLSHDDGDDVFYAEAASDYLSVTGAIPETWVQFDPARPLDPPEPRAPLPLEVPWRIAGPHATGIKVAAELLTPAASPWHATLNRQTLACGEPLQLQVQLVSLGAAPAVTPRGCLVQVRLGSRTYHLPISLSNLSAAREWDLALSAEAAAPTPALDALSLRPLTAWQPYYLYVQNRSSAPRAVIVQLSPGGTSSTKLIVPAGQWQRIAFAGAPPKEHTELPALAGPLVARVLDAETGRQLAEETLPLGIASPREYVEVPSIQFQPAGLKPNRLSLTARATPQLAGPPCLVELLLPPEHIEGYSGAKGGVFRAPLSRPNQSVTLFADGLRLAEETGDEGCVYVNVDDCPRAFVFRATLARQGEATTPYEEPHPALRLNAPRVALAGPNVLTSLEVDQGPADATLVVELGSHTQGVFTAEQLHKFPSPRQARVGFSPFSADGAMLFSAAVRDWQVSFDASGIVGSRMLRARLMAADGRTICTAEQAITLDDTPPVHVQLVDPPRRAAKGVPLILTACGQDDLSGIAQATFFAGQPVDGKLPAGTLTAPGKPDGSGSLWTAALELPPEAKGRIPVGVELINGVGLSTIITATVEIIDPATLALGKVSGSVREGPRPQAGLEVSLKDEKGTEVGKTKTGDDGTFVFEKVAPGKYSLSSSKPTALRKAQAQITVEAGQTAVTTLELQL